MQRCMRRCKFAHACMPASRGFSLAVVESWESFQFGANRGFDSIREAVIAPVMIRL